jgi:hypothetical protein
MSHATKFTDYQWSCYMSRFCPLSQSIPHPVVGSCAGHSQPSEILHISTNSDMNATYPSQSPPTIFRFLFSVLLLLSILILIYFVFVVFFLLVFSFFSVSPSHFSPVIPSDSSSSTFPYILYTFYICRMTILPLRPVEAIIVGQLVHLLSPRVQHKSLRATDITV